MEIFKFYKDTDSKWYIDYPQWEGEKWELEMVSGADTLLDILAQGENEVRLKMSLEEFEDPSFTLKFLREESEGGWYKISDSILCFEIWLCHVTKFVFGFLPEVIYCKH
jgi:hypothetical protein